MRTPLALLAAFSLFALTTSAALASDKTRFENLLRKYARDDLFQSFSPKGACVCMNTTSPNAGGVLITDSTNRVFCGLPTFSPEGNFNTLFQCNTFEVISK